MANSTNHVKWLESHINGGTINQPGLGELSISIPLNLNLTSDPYERKQIQGN